MLAKQVKAGCVCPGDVVSDWKNGLYRLLVTGTRITGDDKVTLSYQYGVRVCAYKLNDLLYRVERKAQ